MTNLIPVADLRRALHFSNRLALTAQACQVNFFWWAHNRYQPVVMLDFDVICAALPSMAMRRMLACKREQRAAPGDDPFEPLETPFENVLGPYTVRLCLENLTKFTVPHGAASELLSWKRRIHGSLNERSRQLLARLEQAAGALDPAAAILDQGGKGGKVLDLVGQEMASIHGESEDLKLLDRILERATPIEDLIGHGRETRSLDAFRTVHGYLQGARPRMSENNLRDAINVSLLVRLFNQPANRMDRPLLISQTRSLTEFSTNGRWFPLRYDQDSPGFIQDEMYLIVSQSLLAFCQNRYRPVIDEAGELRTQANALAEAFRNLLLEIDARGQDYVGVRDDLRLVQHRLKIFQDHWVPVFQQAASSEQLDLTLYSNLLLRPEVAHWLGAGRPEDVRKGIQELIQDLQEYQNPIFNNLNLLMDQTSDTDDDQQERIEKLFVLSVRENDGTPLAESERGRKIDSAVDTQSLEDMRFVLHPVSLPVGAVLALDLWADDTVPGGCRLAIIWQHKANAVAIWKAGVQLLRACLLPGLLEKTGCEFSVTLEAGPEPGPAQVAGKAEWEDVAEEMTKLLDRSQQVEYFELYAGRFTFFADVEPIEEKEIQAGVALAPDLWNPSIREAIANTVAQTGMLSLSAQQYTSILEFIAEKVHVTGKDKETVHAIPGPRDPRVDRAGAAG